MSGGQFSILCVDDEPNILRSLGRLFRREGYRLHFAQGAEEALQILETHPIDLIISDNRMPNITGVQFLALVKARWPDTVRIILSGYTQVSSITQAINEGHIFKFILKPWEDEKLLADVRECLEMASWAKQNKQLRKSESERRAVLSEALSLAQAILDALPVAVIGVSAETIVFSNRAAEAAFGSAAGRLLISRVRDAFSAQLEQQVKQVQTGHAAAQIAYDHPNGAGYMAVCVPLPDAGRQDGAVICFLDHGLGAQTCKRFSDRGQAASTSEEPGPLT